MSFLEIKNVTKKFKEKYALKNISFSMGKGEILSIAGPPGAGKTTLLRVIAGLEKPDSGKVYLNGKDITNLPPHLRNISMVFEIPPIYPDRTGYENIAFPLRLKKFPENEVKRKIYEVAELLNIKHILNRKPDTYSGGEYQRVALARALVTNPVLLLMDEPLKRLDAKIREHMAVWLKQLQHKIGITVVYTTHDPLEAFTIGTRTAILLGGEIKQLGNPLDILMKPNSIDVDDFISIPSLNIFEGNIVSFENGVLKLEFNGITLEKRVLSEEGLKRIEKLKKVLIAIRPGDISISTQSYKNMLKGKVSLIQPLGPRKIVLILVGDLNIRAEIPKDTVLNEDDTVYIKIDPSKTRIYDPETKQKLGG